MSDGIKFSPSEGVHVYEHALPEVRWIERRPEPRASVVRQVLQQRWRIVTDNGLPPRHEWRDVPTVKEG